MYTFIYIDINKCNEYAYKNIYTNSISSVDPV
jgi:hypothetical protein